MSDALLQLALAVFGLAAMWLATGKSPRGVRWAPIVGLCSQPFWVWFAISVSAWPLLVLCGAYTVVYVRGVWLHWGT